VKVGVMGKFGQFNKHDWWHGKRQEVTSIEEEADAVRRYETQLMEEALGTRPKKLLLLKNQMTAKECVEFFKKEALPQSEETLDGKLGLGFAPHRTGINYAVATETLAGGRAPASAAELLKQAKADAEAAGSAGAAPASPAGKATAEATPGPTGKEEKKVKKEEKKAKKEAKKEKKEAKKEKKEAKKAKKEEKKANKVRK